MGLNPLRTIFFGTADLACHSLKALVKAPDINVLGVISQPDKPKGRKLKLNFTPVKSVATAFSLPIWQPSQLHRDLRLIDFLKSLSLDLIVVVAYGQRLPPSILKIPNFGCINVHPSLLPKYRGAAPIHWAILNGESETGISLMRMNAGWDTGAILAQKITAIGIDESADELHDRLALLGASFLIQNLPAYVRGDLLPFSQKDHESSLARKISKSDGIIDWRHSALKIHNQIRALNPSPGTWSDLIQSKKQTRIKLCKSQIDPNSHCAKNPGKVLSVSSQGVIIACGENAIVVQKLQREGGKCLDASAFLAGFSIFENDLFVKKTFVKTS